MKVRGAFDIIVGVVYCIVTFLGVLFMKRLFIFVMVLAVVSGCSVKEVKPAKVAAGTDAIRIDDLKCEYFVNPLGIDEAVINLRL